VKKRSEEIMQIILNETKLKILKKQSGKLIRKAKNQFKNQF